MSKLKSDFKVFVSDEILDFRTLEEKYSRTSPTNFLRRTHSQNAIDVNKHKNTPLIKRQLITTSENISKPLYNSTATLADKYKYPRPKTRSKTVDPRFRKPRSPTHKQIIGSQSTANITNSAMSNYQAKKKPFSPNHVSTPVNRDFRKPAQCTKDSNSGDKEYGNCKGTTFHDQQEGCIEQIATNPEEGKYNINSIGDACNISRPPEITEDEIMEESDSQNNAGDMELTDSCMEKISPYWDDPRLLEKHNVMKPVHSQQIKNSLGISSLSKDHTHNGRLVCRNCLATQWITPTYKYDDKTEICNSSVITNDEMTQSKGSKKEEYSTLIPYMALGSVIGILIISFVAWCLSQYVSWDLSKLWIGKIISQPPEPSALTRIKEYSVYWMNTLYTKVYEIVLMPRSGVLNNNNIGTEEPSRWWSNKA